MLRTRRTTQAVLATVGPMLFSFDKRIVRALSLSY
jgi:hypothetical protein